MAIPGARLGAVTRTVLGAGAAPPAAIWNRTWFVDASREGVPTDADTDTHRVSVPGAWIVTVPA